MKILARILCCLSVLLTLSACSRHEGDDDVRQARARADKERNEREQQAMVIGMVALGANAFARDFGCAPGGPSDLLKQPTPERLEALGCKLTEQQRGRQWREYMAPGTVLDSVPDLSFVRRWDGILVLQWKDHGRDIRQCSFLDAEYLACAALKPI